MNPFKCASLLICVPLFCSAASFEFEAFDLKNCSHWIFSSDSYPSPNVDLTGNRNYLKAAASLAKSNPNYEKEGWSIYSAHNNTNPVSLSKFGACRLSNDANKFECLKAYDFPLSAAAYTIIKYRGQLPTYICTANCEATAIRNIYDMGYENMDGERNIEYEIMNRKFKRLCRIKGS